MNSFTRSTTFTVPLPTAAHQLADTFRQQQSHPRKAKQVYLNTLAVYAVNVYLQGLGIETDLAASDSQDSTLVALADVADLRIKHLGQLECRPVLPDSSIVHIPFESWSDRIGYVAVAMHPSLRTGTLLGFVQEITTEDIPVAQLQPLAGLLEYLDTLQQLSLSPTGSNVVKQTQINLRQWWRGISVAGWQSLEALLEDLQQPLGSLTLAYRSAPRGLTQNIAQNTPDAIPALLELLRSQPDRWARLQVIELLGTIAVGQAEVIDTFVELLNTDADEEIRRQVAISLKKIDPDHPQAAVRQAQLLELGLQFRQQQVILIMTLTPEAQDDIGVHLRVYPVNTETLPPALSLGILDEAGNIVLQEQTREADDWIQLKFSGSLNDRFSVHVAWNGTEIVENFVI
ncbi:DUF1822 family protein [Pantanalinema sp. GBBB05]|uniref:DUF1822 family protein n=1 Tax=Pantanalinema sp. GBBB05 TaxID=2604139 RepID=UPI001D2FC043|nr:DUF1822 family protein [Pantanalinema sp. GBBB05]